ncbi:MAG: polymerase [Solirubrobacteraceae bacterium]|jgi:DNA polymerase-4|nr:polymerase [Solirubrobacteraceae bacterium]
MQAFSDARNQVCEHTFVHRGPAILHADLDAFFASVEQRDDPRLRARPVVVGGGVVMAASYEARACGIRSAMGGARARRLCPDVIVVTPRWQAYLEASRAVCAIFDRTAPVVERVSIDEAFLDVTGLERISGSPEQIAVTLRRTVREEVGLPISVGVATTKVVAKLASGMAKPDGLLVVEPGTELAFLHPLPVSRVWGVGAATAAKLHGGGIRTVADLARAGEPALIALLGRAAGRHLHAVAHNRVVRPVRSGRGRRSLGSQRALGWPGTPAAELGPVLTALVDRVTRRLRRARLAGRTVILRFRFEDFTRATRSRTMHRATAASEPVLATARALLAAALPLIDDRPLTLVGVTLSNLERDSGQLLLPLERRDRAALDAALDEIRDRFGAGTVSRAALLDAEDSLAAWLMPGDDGTSGRPAP